MSKSNKAKPVSPYIQALFDGALADYQRGALAEAERQWQAILVQEPEHADSWHALGVLADDLGRHDVAIAHLGKAIALSGKQAAYHVDLGSALKHSGDVTAAMASYRRALSLAPNYTAHNNLGLILKDRGQLDAAISQYRQALALKPDSQQVHNNLGLALKDQGKLDAAMAHYNQALALWPDYAEAHWNKGFIDLLRGDFQTGWLENEWRLKFRAEKFWPVDTPLWEGEALDSRIILLCHEQGLGDTLQFVRYAPMVKERGGRVILFCPPPLENLFSHVAGIDAVVTQLPPSNAYDCYAPLMSLPGIFATTMATIPAAIPYISVAGLEEKIGFWRDQLPDGTRKIGIVWRGSPTHTNDHNRSIAVSDFVQFFQQTEAQFIGLQKDANPAELAVLETALPKFMNAGPHLNDFTDTAALLLNLDLLISVDTSVVHLAGALSVPVWLLLPFAPDWRWLLERGDSPWYPSMRLFRQARPADWRSVRMAIGNALKSFLDIRQG